MCTPNSMLPFGNSRTCKASSMSLQPGGSTLHIAKCRKSSLQNPSTSCQGLSYRAMLLSNCLHTMQGIANDGRYTLHIATCGKPSLHRGIDGSNMVPLQLTMMAIKFRPLSLQPVRPTLQITKCRKFPLHQHINIPPSFVMQTNVAVSAGGHCVPTGDPHCVLANLSHTFINRNINASNTVPLHLSTADRQGMCIQCAISVLAACWIQSRTQFCERST